MDYCRRLPLCVLHLLRHDRPVREVRERRRDRGSVHLHSFRGGLPSVCPLNRSRSREHVFHESSPVGADLTSEQLS
jgi:hypothetical protein